MNERHFRIAGAYNVRELGGYRTAEGAITRWGRYLRADLLGDIPAESVAALTEYGIRTTIDLSGSPKIRDVERPGIGTVSERPAAETGCTMVSSARNRYTTSAIGSASHQRCGLRAVESVSSGGGPAER